MRAQSQSRVQVVGREEDARRLAARLSRAGIAASVDDGRSGVELFVALEGEELNRVYRRTDDGTDPERATLDIEREVVVRPGTPIAFLPEDIHSIHVSGSAPTLHFHLYGRPLETLSGRLGYELDTGRVVRYNTTHMHRGTQAVG